MNETIKVTAVMEIAAPKINKSKNKTETITPTHANWKNKTFLTVLNLCKKNK